MIFFSTHSPPLSFVSLAGGGGPGGGAVRIEGVEISLIKVYEYAILLPLPYSLLLDSELFVTWFFVLSAKRLVVDTSIRTLFLPKININYFN